MTTATKPRARTLRTIGITALATIVVVVACLWMFQNAFIYRQVAPVTEMQPGWTDVKLPAPAVGGTAKHLPARAGKPTVLVLQGYGYTGGLAATRNFAKAGMGVLLPEYPGHAGSAGSPSKESLEATADGGLAWLRAKGVAADDIVIYGIGLGAGPAIHAARQPHGRLVIVSGVADMGDAVRYHVPMVPDALVKDDWRNAEALSTIKGKITVVHGMTDEEVPYSEGEALAAAAKVPVISLPGDHMVAFDTGLQDALAASFSMKAPRAAPATR